MTSSRPLWILLRFFTIITNLRGRDRSMTRVALGRRVSAFLLGGVTLAIMLVGVVYMTLLRGLLELSGGALLADTLLHKVVADRHDPVVAAVRARGRACKYNAPLWWALYPLAYFAYAVARGLNGDKYPYPFMDVGKLGWTADCAQRRRHRHGLHRRRLSLLVWFDGWRPLGSKPRQHARAPP